MKEMEEDEAVAQALAASEDEHRKQAHMDAERLQLDKLQIELALILSHIEAHEVSSVLFTCILTHNLLCSILCFFNLLSMVYQSLRLRQNPFYGKNSTD